MLLISKFSFSRKMRFSAESTPRCGALHESAALEHLHFFKVKCSRGHPDEKPKKGLNMTISPFDCYTAFICQFFAS
jgi:hypothetical protein